MVLDHQLASKPHRVASKKRVPNPGSVDLLAALLLGDLAGTTKVAVVVMAVHLQLHGPESAVATTTRATTTMDKATAAAPQAVLQCLHGNSSNSNPMVGSKQLRLAMPHMLGTQDMVVMPLRLVLLEWVLPLASLRMDRA